MYQLSTFIFILISHDMCLPKIEAGDTILPCQPLFLMVYIFMINGRIKIGIGSKKYGKNKRAGISVK